MATNKSDKPVEIWHASDQRIKLQATADNPAGEWKPAPKSRNK